MRPAVPMDAYALAGRLRRCDAEEVEALASHRPLEALRLSIDNSVPGFVWAGCIGGQVEALFGCGRSTAIGVGHPWLLASPAIEGVPMTFLRASRKYVDLMQATFPVLTNVADARNVLHHRWLRWLGFEFIKVWPEFGHARIPFLQFVRVP